MSELIDLATLIAALAAVIGIIITGTFEGIRLHRNTQTKHAEFLLEFGKDLENQLEAQKKSKLN